jgi:asparagine synthase (glutamine-hydrolysing)
VLDKLRALFSLLRQFGLRWMLFRAGYALRMKLGILSLQMPAYEWDDRPLRTWLKPGVPAEPAEHAAWRQLHSPRFLFDELPALPQHPSWNPEMAVEEAERILAGELHYFEHTPFHVGFPPDWQLDPLAKVRAPAQKHWSKIPDYGEYDIKFIWEASRFNQVYVLARAYAHKKDERYPEAFWRLVQDWAEKNPPQRGSNWKCGQETSLRMLAFCFGYYAFKNGPAASDERIARLVRIIAAQAERVFANIEYAVSTRGNHAVSEAFGIWLAGTLFPELKQAETYRSTGRRLLEREAQVHIFRDGTYSMYSLNYQRFILHVYFLAIRLGELNNDRFSTALYHSIEASLDFLLQLIDPASGEMPMYGSNDGALVFPVSTCDFVDFRPTLQMGWHLLHGKRLFEAGAWDESLFWLSGATAPGSERDSMPAQSGRSFPEGGIHILHGAQSRVVIRCNEYRERPSHADQLHLDLWWRGRNIACDAGTYLYNGQGIWLNGLAHTGVHNTVGVDAADQMLWLSRFTWGRWAKGQVRFSNARGWQGTQDGYARLGVKHVRSVLALDGDRWLVVDQLEGIQIHRYTLNWLIDDFPFSELPGENTILLQTDSQRYRVSAGLFEGGGNFSLVRADSTSTRGWRSRYYGQKQPALSMQVEANRRSAVFWTFFGFEEDVIRTSSQALVLEMDHRPVHLQLRDLSTPDGFANKLANMD